MPMLKFVLPLLLSLASIPLFAAPVFVGIPSTKISEGGTSRVVERISPEKSSATMCVISEEDSKYFWTSRGNIELVELSSGAYTTFVAVNGSGFIRIIASGFKDTAALAGETETKFDYVEHLLLGLKSVTYYGVAR